MKAREWLFGPRAQGERFVERHAALRTVGGQVVAARTPEWRSMRFVGGHDSQRSERES
jgi:hypothetical protein